MAIVLCVVQRTKCLAMALTSSSTIADALAQYNDNLSWEGTPDKATLALEALRFLLANRPQDVSALGTTTRWADFAKEKERLEAYVAQAGATARAARSSFVRARMRFD